MRTYVIEDELHAQQIGQFGDRSTALSDLRRFASTPWDEPPNDAPCTSWRTCGRHYALIECEVDDGQRTERHREFALEVSATRVRWAEAFDEGG